MYVGLTPVLRFTSFLSVHRMSLPSLPQQRCACRLLKLSTAFACYNPGELPLGIPADFSEFPDNRRQWPAACEVLASLRHLQYARISILSWCQLERHSHSADAALLEEILQPLKSVHAVDFIVEITEPPETIRKRLGATPFRLMQREKPVRPGSSISRRSRSQPSRSRCGDHTSRQSSIMCARRALFVS